MASGLAISSVKGELGDIRLDAQTVVATLASWELVPGDAPGSWWFTARCGSVNAYLITKSPDILTLTVGRQRWRWRGAMLLVEGDRVRATLVGSPEER